MDPANAESANNAGFALYRLQRYEEAVSWFQKAVALDPNRAIAYVNMGDAYLKLQRNPEARQAYEKYLELAPNGSSAVYTRTKLQTMEP